MVCDRRRGVARHAAPWRSRRGRSLSHRAGRPAPFHSCGQGASTDAAGRRLRRPWGRRWPTAARAG